MSKLSELVEHIQSEVDRNSKDSTSQYTNMEADIKSLKTKMEKESNKIGINNAGKYFL